MIREDRSYNPGRKSEPTQITNVRDTLGAVKRTIHHSISIAYLNFDRTLFTIYDRFPRDIGSDRFVTQSNHGTAV